MAASNQSSVSLRDYAQTLWRHKWLIIQIAILIPAIVVAASLQQPTLYTATARITTTSQSPSVSLAVGANIDLSKPDERDLQTMASFVVTREIAKSAVAQLGSTENPEYMMARVTAEADPNADIIAVSAEDSQPQQAADTANAFAEQFVLWRKDMQQKTLNAAAKLLEDQIAVSEPGSTEHATLLERRNQIEVLQALATGGITVGQAAQPPRSPSSPKPLRNGVLALAGALVLGVGLAFVRESVDVKLHSADEIAHLTQLPIIGAIPEFRRNEQSSDLLAVLDDPKSPNAEAYRFLRSNLEFVNFNHDLKVVMVTSPLPRQGKSTTIANLAIALLRAGKRVSVVDADLRRPSLHRYFKATNALGVTSVVSGAVPLSEAARVLRLGDSGLSVTTVGRPRTPSNAGSEGATTDKLSLRLLTSGPLPPNPGEIVSSRQLGAILDQLKQDSDYVLVDAPPMFAVGDAGAMAPLVDGIIVILRLDETTAEVIKGVEDFFSRVPTRALGIVVTAVPRDRRGKYYRYQEYK